MKESIHSKTAWPALPLSEWQDTYELLHLCTQVIGKIMLKLAPPVNHWWHIAMQVTSYGLTTGILHHENGCFQADINFNDHKLYISVEDGKMETIELKTRSVADFYAEVMQKFQSLGISIKIWTVPVEMENRTPFEKDTKIREYKPDYVHNFWKILLETDKVMRRLRSSFLGKASPINFYWGSFDLAMTFFSGRPAPIHPGTPNVGKSVMVEAYSHELCSFGFWPGLGFGEAAFYAYSYPAPDGYEDWRIEPAEAHFLKEMGEFVLPYSKVHASASLRKMVLDFYKSALNAATNLGQWPEEIIK
jgi:hypothetical protein